MQDPYDASDIFGPPPEEDDSETYFYNSLGKPNPGAGSKFGAPRDGGSRQHAGGDWGKPIGTPVRPFAPGVVKFVGASPKGGKFIEVDHGNGVVSRYRHLSATGLAVGTPVGYGDTIGESGNTGTSTTGPHVHAEVLVNGKPVDPTSVFGKSLRGTKFEKPEFDAMDIFLGDNAPANPPADGVAVSGATAANPQAGGVGVVPPTAPPPGDLVGEWHRGEVLKPLEYGGSVEVLPDVAPEDVEQKMDAGTADRMAREAAYYPKSQGFEFGAPPGAAPEEVEQLAIQELAARAGATPEEAVAALRERGVTSFIDVDDPNTELPSIRTQLANPQFAGGPVPVQVGNDWVEAVKEYRSPRAVAGRKAQALTAEAATLPPGSPEALLKLTGARNLLKGVEDNEKMLALQDREAQAYGEKYDELVRDWGYPDDPQARAQYIKRRRELNRQSATDGMNIRDMGRDILQDDSLLTLPTRLPLLAVERGSELLGDVAGSLDTSNGPATPLHEALGRVFRPTTQLEEETADVPGTVYGNIITGFDDALGGWARDETGRSPLDPRDSESDTSRRLDAKPVYGTTQHVLGIGERAAGSLAAMDLTMKPLTFLKSKAIAPEEFSGLRLIEKAAKNEIQTKGARVLSKLGAVAAHPVGDTIGGAATLTGTHVLADIAKDVISGRSLEGAASDRFKTAPEEFLLNTIMLAPGNVLGHALANSGVGLGKLGETIRMESQGRLNVKDLLREPTSAEFREAWSIAAPVLRGRAAIAAGGIAQSPAQTLTQAIADPNSVFDENGNPRYEDVLVNAAFNTMPAIMHLAERNTTKKGEIFEDLGQAEAGKRTRYRVDVDPLTGKKVTGIGGRAVAVGAEQFRAENLQTARALDKVAALKRKNAPIEEVVKAIDGLPDHIQDSILNEYSVKDADGFTSDAEQYMRMARAGSEMASDPTYLERRAQRVLEDASGRRSEVDADVDAELAKAEGEFQNSLRTLYEQKNAEVDALETQRIPEDQVEALRAQIPELQTEAEQAQAALQKAQADYQITHDRLAKEFEQAGLTGSDPKFIPGYQKKVALLTERANALKEAQAKAEAVAQHPDTIKELTKTLQDAEKTNADIDKKIEDLKAKHQDLVVKRGEAYNKAVEAAENRRTTEREAVDKEAQAEATKLLGARDKSIADIEARKASGKPGGTPKLSETPSGAKSEPASGEAAAKAQRDIKNPEQLSESGTDPQARARSLKDPAQMVSDIIDSDKGKAKRVYSDHLLKVAQDARITDFSKEDADATSTVIANTVSYIGKTLGNRKTNFEDVERLIFKGKTFRQAIKGVAEAPRKVLEDGRVVQPRGEFNPADQISTPRRAVDITIFSSGNADTVLHEFAHAVREGNVLPKGDLDVITAWENGYIAQAKQRGELSDAQLNRYGGELFSHAFERYFTQGEVPEGATPELMGAMNHLRGLFERVMYDTKKHLLVSDEMLSPSMKKFFDRFVSDKPELASLSNTKFIDEESDEGKFQVAAKGFVDRVFPFLEAMEKAGSRGDNRARSNWIAAENDLYSMYDTLFPDRRKRDFYRDLYGAIDDPAVFDKIRFAESQRNRAENTRREIETALDLAKDAAIARKEVADLKQREAEILGIFDKEVDKLVVGENEAAPGVDDDTIKDILDGIEAEYAGAGKVAPQKKPFATKENGRASLLVDGIQHDIPLTEVQQAEWDSLERTLNDTLAQDTGDTAENALARKQAIAEYEKGIRDLTGIKSIADLKAEQAEAEKAEADAQKALAEAEKQVANEAAAQAKEEAAKKKSADRIINEAVKDRDARRAREEKEAKAEAERQRKAEEKLQREREKAAAASEKARRAKIATAEKEARVAQATPRKKKITQEEADELKANARSNPAAYVDWNDWKVERYGPRGEYVTMLPPPGHPIRDQWEKAHQDYIAETEALKAAVGRGDLTYERAVEKVNDAQDALFEARNRLGPSAKEWAKARWPELEQPIRMPTEARREAMRGGATAPETVGKWKGGKAPKPGDVRYQDPEEFNPLDPAPEFYSPTERAIEKAFKNGAKGFPAEKTRELLLKSGAKGEELADLGIDDLVANSKGKKISKEDLLTVLNANRLQIEEKTLGDLSSAERGELDALDARLKSEGKLSKEDGARYNQLTDREARLADKPLYDVWKTPGGIEYRELLFRLGGEDASTKFNAGHFGSVDQNRNLLAHGRVQTRNLGGKDYTEVLEIQSDWHQAGRDQGYYPKDGDLLWKRNAAEGYLRDYKASADNVRERIANTEENLSAFSELQRPAVLEKLERDRAELAQWEKFAEGEQAKLDAVNKEAQARGVDLDKLGSGTIADAPLKGSWHKFVLKKMLLDAVKNGHAGILINDGQIQADRYSLDKVLHSIEYRPDPDVEGNFFIGAYKKDGESISEPNATFTPAQVKELLGKEFLTRIQKGEGTTRDDVPGWKVFEGDDLKVEARGMRVFYDEKLPNWLNKYAKEQGWNTKVEPVEIEIATAPDPIDPLSELSGAVESPRKVRMWKFDIPEEVSASIRNKGQPLYQDPNEADPLSDMQLDAFGTNAPAHSDSLESLQDELARIRAQIAQKEQRSTALLNESAKRMDTNFYRAAFREIADMSRAALLSNPAVHTTNLTSLVVNTVANDILAKPVAAAIDRGASLIFGLDPSLTFSYKPELLGAAQMIPKGRGNRDLSKYGGVDEDGNPVRFTKEWREKNLWDLNAWTRALRVLRGDPLTEEYERTDVNWFDKQNRKEMPKALRIFATPLGVAHAYSKTIYGVLGAEDAIAYSGHLAKHIATEATVRAKAEARDGGPTFKQLYDFYSNDPTLDMVERANMHALIATFNNSNAISKGWRKVLEVAEEKGNVLGPPIRTALQFAMPFVQTPSNIIFYEGPSWLGLGIPKGAFNMYRAYKGQKGEFKPSAGATPEQIQKEQQKFAENQKMAKFYQQRAAQQGAQGIIGLAVLAGLAQGLNGYFEPQDEHFMPAFDFNDPQQRDEASAMREAGQGYSGGTIRFKFNGEPVTINMNQIGPTGAIAYAAAGIGSHIRRGEPDKAIQGAFQQLMYMAGSHPLMQDTPLVSTGKMISDWGENLSKPEDKKDPSDFYNLSTAGANISKRLFPPLAFGSLYGDYTDTEDREAKTFSDKMLKMLPWRRSELPVRMSKLNPDETEPKPTLLPRVGGINVDKLLPFSAKPDLAAMDKARATIAETQVLPRKVEPKKDEKPEDFEKRRKEYYANFRKVLEEVQNDPEYLKLPRHETNDVDHILEDLKDPSFKPVTRRDYLQLKLMAAGLFGGKPKVKRAIVE